jgi:hypothetical protein
MCAKLETRNEAIPFLAWGGGGAVAPSSDRDHQLSDSSRAVFDRPTVPLRRGRRRRRSLYRPATVYCQRAPPRLPGCTQSTPRLAAAASYLLPRSTQPRKLMYPNEVWHCLCHNCAPPHRRFAFKENDHICQYRLVVASNHRSAHASGTLRRPRGPTPPRQQRRWLTAVGGATSSALAANSIRRMRLGACARSRRVPAITPRVATTTLAATRHAKDRTNRWTFVDGFAHLQALR